MTCPACRHPRAWRSRRRNVFERLISLVGVSPFRCERCHFRFFRFFRWTLLIRAARREGAVVFRRRAAS